MPRPDTIQVATRIARPGVARLLVAAILLCGSAGLRAAQADNTVQDWNNEFLLITQQTSGNLVAGPPDVAREIAQVGAAMSDAVNAASGSGSAFAYSGGPVANANANVAAATAAYTALYNIFTDPVWQTPITSTSVPALTTNANLPGNGNNSSNVNLANNFIIPELQSFLTSQLSTLGLTSPGTTCSGSSSALCNGYTLGIAAASAVNSSATFSPTTSGAVAAITNGLNANAPTTGPNLLPGTPGVTPGVYVPPTARPEMFPTWNTTTPTGVTTAQVSSALASVNGPPAINSAAYAAGLLQTECQGSSVGQAGLPANIIAACTAAGFGQTAAQAKTDATAALFWNDPGTTVQPPGHWLQIADSAMTSQNSSLQQSAQLTALLGEAMNSAGIAAWTDKYNYNLWRPQTAIKNCDTSTGAAAGSVTWSSDFTTCDAAWASLIATPPHPDYLAGHPAFSGAAATLLDNFFGTDTPTGGIASTSDYYCNGGTTLFTPSTNQVRGCTATSGASFYVCSATVDPVFNNSDSPTLPTGCADGSALTGGDCNTITTTGTNNGNLLICPISETFDSFSAASSGTSGSTYSRVVGGIHTPFSVLDALTVGNAIGEAVASNANIPEPATLSICAVSLLALTGLRRRRQATRV